ncbi:MAG: tetratricopeptide repeat protein [Anaerolineae bacterium]|nr:tetratricopeptide repeat protein [Thermoflexales bacterium]MDW8408187.1 tetratricopeptide repeat protein [Anaerolineae bacterium]
MFDQDQPVGLPVDPEQERLQNWLREGKERQFRQQLQAGTRLLQQGKAKEALSLLKRAHELRPEDEDAALNLGGAYLMSGRHREAIPVLEQAIQRTPDSARLWISLGAAYLGNPILADDEQQLKALSAFQRALQIDPFAPSAAYNMGLVHRDRGEIDLAIAAFRRALKSDPGDQDARRLLERLERER